MLVPSSTLLLASGSPRRMELLSNLGIPFTALPQDVDERFSGLPPVQEACRIAELKVQSLLATTDGAATRWILGADTFIVHEGGFLGKPNTTEEAAGMLLSLQGRSHLVVTGVVLHLPDGMIIKECETTVVHFAQLDRARVEAYLDAGEWMDAAGAYRLQGQGGSLVSRIDGSYTNVMGLPCELLCGILIKHQFPLWLV